MAGPHGRMAVSHSMFLSSCPPTTDLSPLFHLDRSIDPFRVYVKNKILDVVGESTFENTSIGPDISSVAILFVELVCTNVDITVIFG